MRLRKELTQFAEDHPSRRTDLMTGKEVAELLRQISLLFTAGATHNSRVKSTLQHLSRRFALLGDRPVDALFKKPSKHGEVENFRHIPQEIAQRFSQMSRQDVLGYIADPLRTKAEMIQIATVRLGMPHSRLVKMGKNEVAHAIANVVRNEETLSIISTHARQSGGKRS